MINSVDPKNYHNSFECVSQNVSNERYWQAMPESDFDEVVDMPLKKARKNRNYTAIGVTVGSAVLLSAGMIFFVLKGGPKGFGKSLNQLSSYLEKYIQQAKLDVESNSFLVSTLEFLKRKTDALVQKTEIINNYTTIKDYATKKLMYAGNENSIGAKIHRFITRFFEKIAKKTVINSYKETGSLFRNTKSLTEELNGRIIGDDLDSIIEINGEKLTKLEWVKRLAQMEKDLMSLYKRNFSAKNVEARFSQFSDATDKVVQQFNRRGFFWFLSKDVLRSFVADSALLKGKTKIKSEVISHRREISYSLSDILKDLDEKLIEITKLIDYKDSSKLKFLINIRKDLELLAKSKDPTMLKLLNERLTDQINFLQDLVLKSEDISNDSAQQILKRLSEFKTIFGAKQGKVEDILDIYRALLPKSQYEKVKQSFKISVSSLDKSINTETEDFINKLRDLTMGSAPTDIITVITGFLTLGYFLTKSEDNRERASVSLKYGIPAMIGIGTSLYGNAKLFAGSKSMLFGFISMLLTNKLGEITNSVLEARWAQKDKLKQEADKKEDIISV